MFFANFGGDGRAGLIVEGAVVVCLRRGNGRRCLVMRGFGELMGVWLGGRDIISRMVDSSFSEVRAPVWFAVFSAKVGGLIGVGDPLVG